MSEINKQLANDIDEAAAWEQEKITQDEFLQHARRKNIYGFTDEEETTTAS